jgi:hypothetical protein
MKDNRWEHYCKMQETSAACVKNLSSLADFRAMPDYFDRKTERFMPLVFFI